jgi:hypothetical protein
VLVSPMGEVDSTAVVGAKITVLREGFFNSSRARGPLDDAKIAVLPSVFHPTLHDHTPSASPMVYLGLVVHASR